MGFAYLRTPGKKEACQQRRVKIVLSSSIGNVYLKSQCNWTFFLVDFSTHFFERGMPFKTAFMALFGRKGLPQEASPVPPLVEDSVEEYGPWEWVAASGRFSAKDFVLQEDGKLRCPGGASLWLSEVRQENAFTEALRSTSPIRPLQESLAVSYQKSGHIVPDGRMFVR